jgi:phosphoenolpyruvate phosphomutase
MNEWKETCPVVVVPTTYYSTPTQVFADHGISMVIWANHLLRASVTAMQNTAAQIFKDQSLHNVEKEVATVKEIFRLQNAAELEQAEQKYLPGT